MEDVIAAQKKAVVATANTFQFPLILSNCYDPWKNVTSWVLPHHKSLLLEWKWSVIIIASGRPSSDADNISQIWHPFADTKYINRIEIAVIWIVEKQNYYWMKKISS